MNQNYRNINIINEERVALFKALPSNATRKIIIIGASGVGKSAVWKTMLKCSNKQLGFPTRYVSRKSRNDDDPKENQFLHHDYFDKYFEERIIDFYWPKFLPNATDYYGYGQSNSIFTVYGCNNELILNHSFLKSHIDLLSNSIILLVTCSEDIRIDRFNNRYKNQKISLDELSYRLASSENELILKGKSDMIFMNDEKNIENNLITLMKFLQIL